MKLGYNEATCMVRSALEIDLECCERYGYDIIEIRLDFLRRYLERNTLEDLAAFFEKSCLKPGALNAIEPINFLSEPQMTALCAEVEGTCRIANAIGAPSIVVVASNGGNDVVGYTDEEINADTIACMKRLAAIAERYNVKLALEPVGGKKCYVHSLKQGLDIVHAVDSPYVGLALDAFNLYLHAEHRDLDVWKEIPVEKIFVYHLNDGEDRPLAEQDHCYRTMPGDGIFPLKEIRDILYAKGYEGAAAIELFRPSYWEMEPEEVIALGAQKAAAFL